jgi:heptosyltransferase-3
LRILVVRRDNIGDLVCTTPLIDALRARWPQASLAALVTTYNAGVLAGNPALDDVYLYEKLKHRSVSLISHLGDRLRQLWHLRRARFDCVLVPAPTAQALKLARSLAPGKIVAPSHDAPESVHEVERSFELGRSLGVSGVPGPLKVFADAAAVDALRTRCGTGPFVAVHISARRAAQRWPQERYEALLRELARAGRKTLLLWAPGAPDDPRHPGDDTLARALAQAAAGVQPVETPDLRTLIAALSLADRVVCPDGGAMHLAAALGKPVVALFGDSPVARWRPWRVPHRVVRPESGVLADLPLEPVLEALRALG